MIQEAVLRAVALAALTLLARPAAAAADGIMLVQAGAVWMGRDDGPDDEAPRHRVFVHDFWIDREPVTNAELARFLTARRAPPAPDLAHTPVRRRNDEGWIAVAGAERAPATGVSWERARDFCAARGQRLPTEAEWEKTARGGSAAYGVRDLPGALREWTSTAWRRYPYRADDGREPFDTSAEAVVVRGGGPGDDAADGPVTRRHRYERRRAAAGDPAVGFRCATSEDLGEM